MSEFKVGIPRFGNYHVCIGYLVRNLVGADCVYAPPTTKKTLDIGQKYSPDFVCAPFKMLLGNMYETLEKGANVLIGIGGLCRLSYYAELQEKILRDLNFDFKFINTNSMYRDPRWYECLKPFKEDISILDFAKRWKEAQAMCRYIDEIEEYSRERVGFEEVEGSFDKINDRFLKDMMIAKSMEDIEAGFQKAKAAQQEVKINMPSNPIKVAIIGEMYEVMDQYANHFMEKELAKEGILVYRDLALSRMIFKDARPEIIKNLQDYMKYESGASGVYTIENCLRHAKEHVDGIIHLKSFGCTPECDMMPIIQNIAADYKIPVLFLSKDTQTSDTGLKTRLEAFVDMIKRKRNIK